MIVGAVRAVIRCILRHVVSVGGIWPWSDSLEGIQGIQSIRLSNKAASIIDRQHGGQGKGTRGQEGQGDGQGQEEGYSG